MSRDSASCDCSRHRVCARCLERAKKERDEALHAEDVAERYREDAVAERDRANEEIARVQRARADLKAELEQVKGKNAELSKLIVEQEAEYRKERKAARKLEDGYLADIATLNARIKRLTEALRLLLDGPDPHGAETERIARAALREIRKLDHDEFDTVFRYEQAVRFIAHGALAFLQEMYTNEGDRAEFPENFE